MDQISPPSKAYSGNVIGDHGNGHLGDNYNYVTINTKVTARADYAGHYAHNLLYPVSTFVERPTLHDKLQKQLQSAASPEGRQHRVVVVHGAGGVGKTQLVLKYVRQHRNEYNAVFWIEAATRAATERDFVQIYQLLHEVPHVAGLGPTRVEDAVPAVKRWFYGRATRWLFIFDSADNVEDTGEPTYVNLRYFLPDDPSVDVIITTRNARVRKMSSLGGVEVAEMAPEEARILFLKQAEMADATSEEQAEVASIVDELGCLALAVTLAGSYVAETPSLSRAITKYLPEYRLRRKELLDQKPEQLVHQYGASVLTTWEASYEAAVRPNPQIGQFLSLLGWLHWDDIFLSLFEANKENQTPWTSHLFPTAKVDLHQIERFLARLQTYSLLKFQDRTNSYSMHRLIHSWTTDRLETRDQERICTSSILLLDCAMKNEAHRSPLMKGRLIQHLMSNFSQVSSAVRNQNIQDDGLLDSLDAVADFVSSAGRWKETVLVERFILERIQLRYSVDHPKTIGALGNLANTLRKQGQLEEAASIQQEVLAKRRRILGEDYPNIIGAMHNLALTMRDQGQLEEAALIQQEVLAKRRQILGEDYPNTITVMHNLAVTMRDQGQLEEAVLIQQEVLAKQRQILGEDHPDTIMAMQGLALTMRKQGQLEEAALIQQEVLAKRRQILGEDHPDTITAMHNLAVIIRDQGQLEEAVLIQQEVLAKQRRILGEDHPNIIGVMHNLALTMRDQGQLEEAALIQQEVLVKRRQILGEDHPNTIRAMHNLALTMRDQGQLEEAALIQQEVLAKRRRILGEDHPDTIKAMNNLAVTLRDQGQLEEATLLLRKAHMLAARRLGEAHPLTQHCARHLSTFLHNPGQS